MLLTGPEYQAEIPPLLEDSELTKSPDADLLLWCPGKLPEKEVSSYLSEVYSKDDLPPIMHHDDEAALFTLHKHNYQITSALADTSQHTALYKPMKPWSEKECELFENGLRMYGKQFNVIQKNLISTRTISEVIQFYYLWKKTERYGLCDYS